jgi:hypothetical protein
LGESGTTAGTQRLRGAEARIATGIAAVTLAVGLTACGGGQRQDVTEPSGNFPVQVTKAKFPSNQLLANNYNLELAIKNVGDETVPNLAVTIYTLGAEGSGSIRTKGAPTSTGSGQGSFNIRLDDPALADPNRPVCILDDHFPKLLSPPTVTLKNLNKAPSAGAAAAQTDTFQFGPMKPGESRDIVWRVAAVRAGSYTTHYEVAAGLEGKADAVNKDGGPVKDELHATISAKPPPSCVTGTGEVEQKNRCAS